MDDYKFKKIFTQRKFKSELIYNDNGRLTILTLQNTKDAILACMKLSLFNENYNIDINKIPDFKDADELYEKCLLPSCASIIEYDPLDGEWGQYFNLIKDYEIFENIHLSDIFDSKYDCIIAIRLSYNDFIEENNNYCMINC